MFTIITSLIFFIALLTSYLAVAHTIGEMRWKTEELNKSLVFGTIACLAWSLFYYLTHLS